MAVVDFDDVLPEIGTFDNKYHKLIIFCVLLPVCLPGGLHQFNQLFMQQAMAAQWCHLPQLPLNNLTTGNIALHQPAATTAGSSNFPQLTIGIQTIPNETTAAANFTDDVDVDEERFLYQVGLPGNDAMMDLNNGSFLYNNQSRDDGSYYREFAYPNKMPVWPWDVSW